MSSGGYSSEIPINFRTKTRSWKEVIEKNLPVFNEYMQDYNEANSHVLDDCYRNVDGADLLEYLLNHKLDNLLLYCNVPKKLRKCGGCKGVYTDKWEYIVDSRNGKKILTDDKELNLYIRDAEGNFEYIDRLWLNGDFCPSCLEAKSEMKAREKPEYWLCKSSFPKRFFEKHIHLIPYSIRKRFLPALVEDPAL